MDILNITIYSNQKWWRKEYSISRALVKIQKEGILKGAWFALLGF